MKLLLLASGIFLFTLHVNGQTLAYADTVSTPIGQFMLETNEALISSVSFDHQTQTAADGGEVESVNFFPSSERRASEIAPEKISFNIKPNPVNEMANLQLKNGGSALTVTISDITGRVISTKNYYSIDGNYQSAIDLSEYTPGIYFVELNTGGYHFSQKLVKE
jgi:hypothetical protein